MKNILFNFLIKWKLYRKNIGFIFICYIIYLIHKILYIINNDIDDYIILKNINLKNQTKINLN